MAEYIEREALIFELARLKFGESSLFEKIISDGVYAVIGAMPAEEVAPVRHGRWALNKKYGDYECSECGQGDVKAMDFTNLKMRYCPNCGAKMDDAE